MIKKIGTLCLALTSLTVLNLPPAWAQNKDQYHLFNPTPTELMRDMSTDRPDKTESAYTVDAGHFQYEIDLATFVLQTPSALSDFELLLAPFNIKAGLNNQSDLQIIFAPLNWQRSYQNAQAVDNWGSGSNLSLRLKYNLWGNDGGETAFSLMPFVSLPTQSGAGIEGGIITPFAWNIDEYWALGAQLEFDAIYQGSTNNTPNYAPLLSGAITIGRSLNDEWGVFAELFAASNLQQLQNSVITLDGGVTYSPIENLQWDAGVYIGLTPASPIFQPFLGLSQRF